MNAVLIQIAAAIGFCLGSVTFIVCMIKGSALLSAILRASMTMVLSSLIVTLFFRFFAGVLYDFIAQKQKEQQEAEAAAATKPNPDDKRERRRDIRSRRTESADVPAQRE